MGIVQQDECDPGVGVKVADAQVLRVPPKVGEANRFFINNSEKSYRTAAKLDVGPARLRNGRLVKAIACFDEMTLLGAERILAISDSL